MTQLTDALGALGLTGEIGVDGRWVRIQGANCVVYVVETSGGGQFYTWCDDPEAREIEVYQDATKAISAGLRRAATVERKA